MQTSPYIVVDVKIEYHIGKSNPDTSIFLWEVTTTMHNNRKREIIVEGYHWVVMSEMGYTKEYLSRRGVHGRYPRIAPEACKKWVHEIIVPTPSAMLLGSYQMTEVSGTLIDANIPTLALDSPHINPSLH